MNRTQMVLGWTWRTMLGGEEQFYHGIVGHDGIPTPNYYEYQKAATDMNKLQDYGFPYVPKPDIAVAYNQESEWVTLRQRGHFRQKYEENIIKVHKVFYESNQEYNVVDLRNLKNEYKLLIVPEHVLIEPSVAETIRNYVNLGGTVIMTGYSGNVDETGKAFSVPKPGNLSDVFGIRVAGFYRTNIKGFHSENTNIVGTGDQSHELLKVAKAGESFMIDVDYYEDLELKTAESFATFQDKNMCAVSVNHYGKGTAYYIAAETNQTIVAWLVDYLTGELGLEKGVDTPEGVQARKIAENQDFYVNTTDHDVMIPLVRPGKGILSDKYYDTEILLKAYDAELIVSE
jgi:beta-galactosidase